MRLFLLPITTRRTLLYCQRIHVTTTEKKGILDKVTSKAAQIWAGWEKKEGGWQKKVVGYGNHALRRIPYEEWGLKSVPPISSRKKNKELKDNTKVEVVFPKSVLPSETVEGVLATLATERDALHRKRFIWCLIGMPITAPLALIPIIPNLPFFYLVYRAWSHWRALAGGDHLEFLIKNKLLSLTPSKVLDNLYPPITSRSLQSPTTAANKTVSQGNDHTKLSSPEEDEGEEDFILSHEDGRRIAEALELPELEIEMERAIWQINQAKNSEENTSHPPKEVHTPKKDSEPDKQENKKS